MANITLKPISGSGSSWTGLSNAYDNTSTTYASVSVSSSNYSSRIATFYFDTSSIPSNAEIESVTLKINAKASTSSRVTLYADINGNSSNRVISSSLPKTQTDLTGYISESSLRSLSYITLTGYTTSGTQCTVSIYEIDIEVEYTSSSQGGSQSGQDSTETIICTSCTTLNEETGANSGYNHDLNNINRCIASKNDGQVLNDITFSFISNTTFKLETANSINTTNLQSAILEFHYAHNYNTFQYLYIRNERIHQFESTDTNNVPTQASRTVEIDVTKYISSGKFSCELQVMNYKINESIGVWDYVGLHLVYREPTTAYLGTQKVQDLYFGSQKVQRLYLGTNLVYGTEN